MPNRKYKCPAVGQLVCVKQHIPLYRVNCVTESGNTLFFNPRVSDDRIEPWVNSNVPLKPGDIALFLGIFEMEHGGVFFRSTQSWSYKFLIDDNVVYTLASFLKPKQWLMSNIKVFKNGNKRKA